MEEQLMSQYNLRGDSRGFLEILSKWNISWKSSEIWLFSLLCRTMEQACIVKNY